MDGPSLSHYLAMFKESFPRENSHRDTQSTHLNAALGRGDSLLKAQSSREPWASQSRLISSWGLGLGDFSHPSCVPLEVMQVNLADSPNSNKYCDWAIEKPCLQSDSRRRKALVCACACVCAHASEFHVEV